MFRVEGLRLGYTAHWLEFAFDSVQPVGGENPDRPLNVQECLDVGCSTYNVGRSTTTLIMPAGRTEHD